MSEIKKFNDIIGQKHLLSEGKPIFKMVENNTLVSMILHGPPGIGKTTLANFIAQKCEGMKINLNAATMSKDDLKQASELLKHYPKVILIIDEIHRMDKTRQDYLLPFLENPNFIMIATTTENPYYDVRVAMRSRCIIFELYIPQKEEIKNYLLDKILVERKIEEQVVDALIQTTACDVRMTLNVMNFLLVNYTDEEIDIELIKNIFTNNIVHDKNADNHHNLLSALQKSIRASDVNAALHYSARLLLVGEYKSLFRRLIVIAYEDISNANPTIGPKVVAAMQAFDNVGMPEGRIIIATIIVDMALSPKSNAAYLGLDKAMEEINQKNITSVNENIKYNQKEGFEYDRDKAKYMNLLPQEVKRSKYYFSNDASKYEKALNDNYKKREEKVRENER